MPVRLLSGANLNGQRIQNVGLATAGTDAITRQQVEDLIRATPTKADVKAATTANVTLSGAQTIDGVSLVAGDRVLVRAQTAPAQNGIYEVAGGAWNRTTDADLFSELAGAVVGVQQGTTLADTIWRSTADIGGTLGTTAIPFVQIGAGGGGVTSVSAGTGITVTGGVATPTVAIDPAVVMRRFATAVGNGALTSIPVVHNLGTRDVHVEVYDSATFEGVIVDVVRTDANTVTLVFPTPPAASAFRCVVIG